MTIVSLKQLYFMASDIINESTDPTVIQFATAVHEYVGIMIQGDTREWDEEYNDLQMLSALDEIHDNEGLQVMYGE